MSRGRRASGALLAIVILAAAGAAPHAAGAQEPASGAVVQADTVVREVRILRSGVPPGGAPALPQPLILDVGPGGTFQVVPGGFEPALTAHEIPALSGSQLESLRAVQRLRQQGLLERAAEALGPLLAELPHHAMVLYERARLDVAGARWEPLEKMARSERAAAQDSLLLTRELVLAQERLGRPRDAVATALECWVAAPTEAEWAFTTIARLAGGNERGVREQVRRIAERFPQRPDLVRGHARLEWKLGDDRQALRVLLSADGPGVSPPLRWSFAEELLRLQSARDSSGAEEALVSLAGDARLDAGPRVMAARRAWDLHRASGSEKAGAPRIHQALHDIPPARWNADLLVGVARGLRQAGMTVESRALLETPNLKGAQFAQATLERALADLRDGPPEKSLAGLEAAAGTSPEARFRYAEGLFFAGLADSAKGRYRAVSENPSDPYAGAALERIYLIEDAEPKSALVTFGRMAWHDWRGDEKVTLTMADSLFRALSPGPLWARVAVFLSERREAAGQYAEALAPLLELANQRPGDRLAPLARQRAGDLYLLRLKDPKQALAQYEECLTRYPRAWNSAEVRRKLEALRKQRF